MVALRIFCRVYYGQGRTGSIGLDDYITIFCVLVLFVTCVLVDIGSTYGLGRHITTLKPPEIVQALKWNVIISSVLIWSFSLPKFAIVAILKRILDYGTKTAILFWGLALTSQACILATSVWWWKQCDPVERGWNTAIKGTCAPVSVLADLGYFTSAYSAFLDIFFALYPIPFIMRLNMPMRNRVAVSIALGLSVLACTVSIYKLVIFGQVFEVMSQDPTCEVPGPQLTSKPANDSLSTDPVPFLDILGVAEGSILIICASLPTLGPLIRTTKGKISSLQSGADGSHAPISGAGSQGSGTWATIKGHKLGVGDPRRSGPSSTDDIPLMHTATLSAGRQNKIQKKMEFTVTSERY